MKAKKYMSEFGLNMMCGYSLLLQQDNLHVVDEVGVEPHIYFIGRRPRITVDPESIKISADRIAGVFRKQVKDTYIDIPFDVLNLTNTEKLTFKSDYPYTEFAFLSGSGEIVAQGACALLLFQFGSEYWSHLDVELLYVGQAYGKDGSRTAADRLKKHETLQGIYNECMRRSPDQDIWLFLSTFEPILVGLFDPNSESHTASVQEDDEHISTVLSRQITEAQRINFTEAALIRHFQPSYNVIYKNSFPNPAHLTYSECYDVDLNMVSVEINTEVFGFRFWSPSVQSKWCHICSFPLHSREDRVYMFEFAGKDIV